jgi:regulator of replication initiation timing
LGLLKQLLPLVAEIGRLRQRVEELEAENERLKSPSANSRNSSQPPSRDQKVNQPPKKKRKRHGSPFGHPKYSRRNLTLELGLAFVSTVKPDSRKDTQGKGRR